MKEYEEDFTLKDMDIKSKTSFWDKLDKKKVAKIAIISFSVISLLIIIIVIAISLAKDKKNKKPSIGEIICEYNIQDTKKETMILSKDYIKTTSFDIVINNKAIKYNKGYKFDKIGTNIIVYKIQQNINMDYMFKDIQTLISINITSTKNAKITSMISTFENCENLNIFNINGFNTSEVKSMHKLFYKTSIQNINLNNFNIENVNDMSYMFASSSINDIDFSNININSVTNMSHIFSSCSSLKNINISPLNSDKL